MPTPKLWAGASGYAYKEWKGNFYPDKIKPQEMLAWYAERLPTVEINNTFYQTPKAATLEHWAQVTPPGFRFAIKASRRITHDGRLKADKVAESVAYLYDKLATRWQQVHAYFMHEPTAPGYAATLLELAAGGPTP
ncbi:MAG: DUF72 domain-containing protein [Rubrivivax sp.]